MLDETESSTALKPKISLEMLLRDGIILGKKYFKRYQDAFFFFFSIQEDCLDFQRISCGNSDNHGDFSTFSCTALSLYFRI